MIHHCWICGRTLDLKACKTDEHGMPVHESCYAAKICKVQQTSKPMRTAPADTPTATRKPEP
jgi:hypothetical protein